jgi:hypothetical protein
MGMIAERDAVRRLLQRVGLGPCPRELNPAAASGFTATLATLTLPAAGPDAGAMVTALSGLGQVPFPPPKVGGWPRGNPWLTTVAALNRLRTAQTLVGIGGLSPLSDAAAPARGRDSGASGPAHSHRPHACCSTHRECPTEAAGRARVCQPREHR